MKKNKKTICSGFTNSCPNYWSYSWSDFLPFSCSGLRRVFWPHSSSWGIHGSLSMSRSKFGSPMWIMGSFWVSRSERSVSSSRQWFVKSSESWSKNIQ
jgi:hypothetical protein